MPTAADLLEAIHACPEGMEGWKAFEDACIAALEFAFVPPLRPPQIQVRTLSGLERRDALFPNHELDPASSWGFLYRDLSARMILTEFKNYGTTEIGKDEVIQLRSYMKTHLGRLALLCCNKKPSHSAYQERNNLFHQVPHPVILFLLPEHLGDLMARRERGEDPADLIVDLVDEFLASVD